MTKNSIKLLLSIATVAILFVAYMYVVKPNMDDKKALESEVAGLQARYDDLKSKEANRDFYVSETERYLAEFEDYLAWFPANLDKDVEIMFVKSLEKDEGNLQFDISSTGLGDPQQFYTLGGENGAYECYKAAYPISYTGSYEGVKDFIDFIMNYKYRMNVSNVSITMSEDANGNESYTGTITMNAYAVYGEDRTPDTVTVDVENGLDNIFHGGDGSGASSLKSYPYDEDNGASIASNYDINILLNNANSDAADGIIVAAGGSSTYVTSSENSVQRLIMTVFEEDGKNYVTYSIGDQSYTAEITSDDLKVYVESSARVDADDSNGVRVTLDNSTSIPVFFKVDGDDASSARFTMGSKTGTAKVY